MQVKKVKVSEIKEYENNPRIHTREQIERLKESLKEFGFVNPVILTQDHVLVAGHGRLAAAKALGLSEVPAIIVDFDEEKARAYRIADNQLTILGDWDFDKLSEELQALSEDSDLFTALGFDDDELHALIGSISEDTESLEDLLSDSMPSIPSTPAVSSEDNFPGQSTEQQTSDASQDSVSEFPSEVHDSVSENVSDVWQGEGAGEGENASESVSGRFEEPSVSDVPEMPSTFRMDLNYAVVIQLGSDLDKANDLLAFLTDSLRKITDNESELLHVLNVTEKRDFRFDTRKYTVMVKLQRLPEFNQDNVFIYPVINTVRSNDSE